MLFNMLFSLQIGRLSCHVYQLRAEISTEKNEEIFIKLDELDDLGRITHV